MTVPYSFLVSSALAKDKTERSETQRNESPRLVIIDSKQKCFIIIGWFLGWREERVGGQGLCVSCHAGSGVFFDFYTTRSHNLPRSIFFGFFGCARFASFSLFTSHKTAFVVVTSELITLCSLHVSIFCRIPSSDSRLTVDMGV
jgi:hypothetical protein